MTHQFQFLGVALSLALVSTGSAIAAPHSAPAHSTPSSHTSQVHKGHGSSGHQSSFGHHKQGSSLNYHTSSHGAKFNHDYHTRHGVKFSHGHFYRGRNHHHWSRHYYSKSYRCNFYYCPSTSCWYYWNAPAQCYYPASYMSVAPPTVEEPPSSPDVPGVPAEGETPPPEATATATATAIAVTR